MYHIEIYFYGTPNSAVGSEHNHLNFVLLGDDSDTVDHIKLIDNRKSSSCESFLTPILHSFATAFFLLPKFTDRTDFLTRFKLNPIHIHVASVWAGKGDIFEKRKNTGSQKAN